MQWLYFGSALAAAALLGSSTQAVAQELKPEVIYQRLLPSVLTLKVLNQEGDRTTGSGFLALREGLAVTCWHLVHDAQHVYGILADGQRVDIDGLVDRDESRDLALVHLGKSSLHLAKLSAPPPIVGARVYIMGAPKGFGFSIAEGLLSQVQTIDGFRQYQLSCPFSTGNSGGPVINDQGEVIAVASWSRIDGQNLNFAVPVDYLGSLDPTRTPVPWAEVERGRSPRDIARDLAQSEADIGLIALRKHLKEAAGRRVTIVVREADREEQFNFVVPE